GSLGKFLESTNCVIDLTEYAAAPERYPGLSVPQWLLSLPGAWLVVPLPSPTGLVGFVVLVTARASIKMDWEVLDLLKTAGSQAASYLGQIQATEALLEVRKFDAFNRMSAFVVHDLKNLVAQLSLLLRNAERHRNNPEFQRDMLLTVVNVVERMNKLMLQLRTGATPVENPRSVNLERIIRSVCVAKSEQDTSIEVDPTPGISAMGHADQLEHVIGHVVQNALDATSGRGKVVVRSRRENDAAVIEVTDSGVGMTSEFIRDRLFRPFQTTKETGMGVGVYESSQYVTGLGGQILIDSTPDVGTRVRVVLPLGHDAAAPNVEPKEAAWAKRADPCSLSKTIRRCRSRCAGHSINTIRSLPAIASPQSRPFVVTSRQSLRWTWGCRRARMIRPKACSSSRKFTRSRQTRRSSCSRGRTTVPTHSGPFRPGPTIFARSLSSPLCSG